MPGSISGLLIRGLGRQTPGAMWDLERKRSSPGLVPPLPCGMMTVDELSEPRNPEVPCGMWDDVESCFVNHISVCALGCLSAE